MKRRSKVDFLSAECIGHERDYIVFSDNFFINESDLLLNIRTLKIYEIEDIKEIATCRGYGPVVKRSLIKFSIPQNIKINDEFEIV